MEKSKEARWLDVKILSNALVTYNYKMVSSATGYTPEDARQPKNKLEVKMNLNLKRKRNRLYPEIKEGDKVRIYTKKNNFQKERVPVWSENVFTVDKIEEKSNHNFYYLNGRDKPL